MTAHATPAYSVALIADAPGLTLADVYAELLPLALVAGFSDLSLDHHLSAYGSCYTAHAHLPGTARTIAHLLPSLPSLLDTAREALYAYTPAASLL